MPRPADLLRELQATHGGSSPTHRTSPTAAERKLSSSALRRVNTIAPGGLLAGFRSGSKSPVASPVSSPTGSQLIRARSECFLTGVSESAEFLNSKQDYSFNLMVKRGLGGGGRSPLAASLVDQHLGGASPQGKPGVAELEEFDFARDSEQLVNSISDLQRRIDTFEGADSPQARGRANSFLSPGFSPTNKDSRFTQEEQDRAERLAERLEAYKMVRKVEGELPALAPLTPLPRPPPSMRPDQTIVRQNALASAIQAWSPSKRLELVRTRLQENEARTTLAAVTRETHQAIQSREYHEALLRKREQAERAVASRREPKKVVKHDPRPEQWLSIVVLAHAMTSMVDEVKLHRMPQHDRLRYATASKSKSTSVARLRRASIVVHQALLLSSIMEDPVKTNRLNLVTAMVRSSVQVRASRQKAATILQCLQSWQVAGRCFKCFKSVTVRIVMLQRWWRTCLKQLHEVRDQIARRWEKLERAQLMQEQHLKAHPGRTMMKNTAQQTRHFVEDKVQGEMLDEAVRLRFIENDLRVRRYNLLPQITIWEKEVKEWRGLYAEWQDTKDAHRALGKEVPAMKIFHWPPVRPSYLPRAHRFAEARGAPCEENCIGRQGDEEIINMWRAARRGNTTTFTAKKGSVSRAPTSAGPVSEVHTTKKRGSVGGRACRRKSSEEGAPLPLRPFDDVAEEELSQWGVSPAAYPGLSVDDSGTQQVPTV